jgi:hypothetical protein
VLRALHELAVDHGRPRLVVSIPNVTHVDLAAKLLLGRWDVTPTGLLDETHVALYSPGRIDQVLSSTGWAQLAADDFPLDPSDQHFPADAAPLAETPLHDLLASVRDRAAPGATTNQFVRAYAPVSVKDGRGTPPAPEPEPEPEPLLSILLLPGEANDSELTDTLVSLDAQSVGDAELVVVLSCTSGADATAARRRVDELLRPFVSGLAARSRVVTVTAPPPASRARALDAGVAAARGRYVTVLDGTSVAFAHFVETYARLAAERPGAVLRARAISQQMRPTRWPGDRSGSEPAAGAVPASARHFSLVDHLAAPGSPPGSYALATSCFADLGLRFEDALSGAEEDEVLWDAAMLCGVHEAPDAVVVLLHETTSPDGGSPRDADAEGGDATAGRGEGSRGAGDLPDHRQARLVARLDSGPVLLPAGSLAPLVAERRRQLRELQAGEGGRSGANGPSSESGASGGGEGATPGATRVSDMGGTAALRAGLASALHELDEARKELDSLREELDAARRSGGGPFTAALRRIADEMRHPSN